MTSKWGRSRPVTQKRQKDASRLATADAQERIPTADPPTRRHVSSPLRRHADTPTRRHVLHLSPTRRHADTPTRFFTLLSARLIASINWRSRFG